MIRFEWDENKNKANHKKHRIWFEEACQVFDDHLALRYFDTAHSSSAEDRFLLVGESEPNRVLLVVFCERDGNTIRIISARKATQNEKRQYEKGI